MGASPRFCPECGTELRPGVQFCTECGHTAGEGGHTAGEDGAPATQITRYADEDGPSPGYSPDAGRRGSRRGDRGRSRLLAIVAGVAVAGLAAIFIVAGHLFSHQPSPRSAQRPTPALARHSGTGSASSPGAPVTVPASPSPSSAQQAAVSLAALLAQSVTDRSEVNNAYNDASNCGPDLSQDVRTFKLAAASRNQLLGELASLPGRSALPQQMLSDLATAWQASKKVDNDYAGWAQDEVSGGCSAGNQSDPRFLAASGPNQQATDGKTAFVQMWNQLAQTYGLTQYQQGEL
jgi:zinc-ribbon domain